jgi:putative ABC transport system permease protein
MQKLHGLQYSNETFACGVWLSDHSLFFNRFDPFFQNEGMRVSLVNLVFHNIKGNAMRSFVAFFCVLGVSAFFISTMVVSRGTQESLQKGLQRLGADLLVVPLGAQTDIETALLMGKPSHIWMSDDYLRQITAMDGVAATSPQIYLQSLFQAACCSVSETFLVVYDPASDFTITPWLQQKLGRALDVGEVIGGAYIFSPDDDGTIRLYGTTLRLAGNLEPTGTGMDQTIFFTMDTAQKIAANSVTQAVSPLVIPEGKISSILVKLEPGIDVHQVMAPIFLYIPDVVPIPSPQLFGTFRDQMLGLLGGIMVFMALAWILSAVLIALVFSMSANERRRQMAVLRAMGATRWYILRSLLAEGSLLAVAASTVGSAIGILCIFIFQRYIAGTLKIPFLFPSITSLLGLYLLNLIISLTVVVVATVYPAIRISQTEPALAMRE